MLIWMENVTRRESTEKVGEQTNSVICSTKHFEDEWNPERKEGIISLNVSPSGR